MSKKFNTENVQTGRVYGDLAQATGKANQQGEASPQEIKERQDNLQTQGRKGAKAYRINMAFTPDNHEFLRIMGKVTGKTMTQFCNLCIERYRKEHPDIYEKAQEIITALDAEDGE